MAAHRYWRILVKRSQSGGNAGIGELQMRTSIGGANVASGGTPSASSSKGTYTAAKAFDGLTVNTGDGNGWASNGGYSGGTLVGMAGFDWLKYDFGAGNEKDIQEIVMFCPGTGGLTPPDLPASFDVQYSDDNAIWTTQRALSVDTIASPWTASSSKVFDVRPLGAIDIHNTVLFDRIRHHPFLSPGQPTAPVYDPNTEAGQVRTGDRERYYADLAHGGMCRLAGTTTSLSIPAPRRVRLYHQYDGRLHSEKLTGSDGVFEFKNIEIGPWTVVGVDDTGTQMGVIYSHVSAVPM